MRYVIVGNGPAGINAIESIRKVDPSGEIINISEEKYFPYSKPVMPHYISGHIPLDGVFFREKDFYNIYKVIPVLGDGMCEIEPDKSLVILRSGRRIPFDKLLLATGGKPRKYDVEGSELKGIYYLTSLSYVEKIVEDLPEVKNAIVLGGGPLGLKASFSIANKGINVKLLVASAQVMSQVVDPDSAKILEEKLYRSAVELRLKTDVLSFEGDERVRYANLNTGERIPCELVVIGKGVEPHIDYINPQKIRMNVGIIVNHFLETSIPNIYAAGDVAESYDILTGGSNTVAVWPRASEQGHFAGMNMAGFKKPYPGAHRMNSLDFEGVSCIVMGDVRTIKKGFVVVTQKDPRRSINQRIILENGKIRGAAIIGRIVNVSGLNRFLRKRLFVENIKDSLLEEKATFIY